MLNVFKCYNVTMLSCYNVTTCDHLCARILEYYGIIVVPYSNILPLMRRLALLRGIRPSNHQLLKGSAAEA